jgi:hypothetical protein
LPWLAFPFVLRFFSNHIFYLLLVSRHILIWLTVLSLALALIYFPNLSCPLMSYSCFFCVLLIFCSIMFCLVMSSCICYFIISLVPWPLLYDKCCLLVSYHVLSSPEFLLLLSYPVWLLTWLLLLYSTGISILKNKAVWIHKMLY